MNNNNNNNNELVLVADCGGTRTRVRLYNKNRVILGDGSAGPSNLGLGASNTISQLIKASTKAIETTDYSGYPLNKFKLCAGIAGLITEKNRLALQNTQHPFEEIIATTDAHTALLGAFNGQDGGILILGTGSCGFGQIKGETISIGGWGIPISDQGSGARLGSLAVRHAVQAFDKIKPQSVLTSQILDKLGGSAKEAYHWSQTATPSDYGAFSPMIFDAARHKDKSALDLIEVLSEEVSEMIRALHEKGCEEIALFGGLATPIKEYLPANSLAHLVEPKSDALWGAYLLKNLTSTDLVHVKGNTECHT